MSEPIFETAKAVGICTRTNEPHWFYWDCDRDTERMDIIHGKDGLGHADPLANYGAVMCKHCDCKALVLINAKDFPEV